MVHQLVGAGRPIKAIKRRTGLSRGLIRAIVRSERTDVFRVRQSSLEPYLPRLDARWDEGSRNATALWRELRGQGFSGSLPLIGEWATRREGECGGTSARTFGSDRGAPQDHQPRATDAIGGGHGGCDRRRRPGTGRGTGGGRPLAGGGACDSARSVGGPVHAGGGEDPRRGSRGADPAGVQWADRGVDHEAEARETADVWVEQDQPAPGPPHRRVRDPHQRERARATLPCQHQLILMLRLPIGLKIPRRMTPQPPQLLLGQTSG